MGFVDDLLAQAGGLSGIANSISQNPQLLAAAVSLLSSRDATVGGTGGLGGLVQAFQNSGLDDVVASWISNGQNKAISADALTSVLGADTIGQFAAKAGIDASQAGPVLASLLPAVINHLTPDGALPEASGLEQTLGGLLSGLMNS